MHTRCDQKALPCKHWIKGSVTLSCEASAEDFSQSTEAISYKKETATYFRSPRSGPFYSSWKTLSPARHESQRHTFSSGLRTFQLPSKQFNDRIITMMNTRIMNSTSSIIHNISPLLWLLFWTRVHQQRLAIFQMKFYCYVFLCCGYVTDLWIFNVYTASYEYRSLFSGGATWLRKRVGQEVENGDESFTPFCWTSQ